MSLSFREKVLRGRARREAKSLVADVRSTLARYAYKVAPEVKAEVEQAAAELDKARLAEDHDGVCRGLARLDELADRSLSFARRSAVAEYARSIGAAVLIALLLRAFVVEAFQIPSGSMIPTMQVGDRIFVNKFLYGIRIPFTNTKLFTYRKPKRGEVIVFIYPIEPEKDFIKRVVAVEGDSVEVRRNVLYVNGKEVPQREISGPCTYWDADEEHVKWSQKICRRFEETMDGHGYTTYHDPDGGYRDFPELGQPSPYVVPKGNVFVMGDNRDNSKDSRFWGPVPLENIKGKALVVWWSSGSPEGIRWQRLGKTVP